MNKVEMMSEFSEVYINYIVWFGSENYDPIALKAEVQALLGDSYGEILDAEDKPEGAWGYRKSNSSAIVGYTQAENNGETPSTLAVVARVFSEDLPEENIDITYLQGLMEKALATKALKNVAVDDTYAEITLYYSPFESSDSSSKLELLASLLMPERRRNEKTALDVFDLSYKTSQGVYTKQHRYTYAKNSRNGKEALSVEITIQNDTRQRSVNEAIRDLNGIDTIGEIAEEAKYLEEKRKTL